MTPRMDEKYYICRRVHYGKNNNLVRYEAITPHLVPKKDFLARLAAAWKRKKWVSGF